MMDGTVTKMKSSCLYELMERIDDYDRVYIYGAGNVGKFVFKFLSDNEKSDKVASFMVTNPTQGGGSRLICDRNVQSINDVEINDKDLVLLAARADNRFEMFQRCQELNIKNFIEIDLFDSDAFFIDVPPEEYQLMLEYWYRMKTGRDIDLDNPRTFNEKIQWLKIHDCLPIKTPLSDKYVVRDFVKEKVGEKYLVPLLGVWDKFDDIDFDKLPNQFVLKCNHGAAWNVIVKDKSQLDIKDAKSKMDKWLNTNYAYRGLELQYKDIVPKIIAEKYLEDEEGDLKDYKFFCFGGKVEFIQRDKNRNKGHHVRRFYTRGWEPLDFLCKYPMDYHIVPPPPALDEMLSVVETLARGFRHVRVDLYYVDGQVYFGEMTFTHGNGLSIWSPEVEEKIGNMISTDEV